QNNANIVVNSSLAGTGGLTLTDTTAGTIALNSANSYTGTTTINANPVTLTLTLGNLSAFSNGSVNFTSGTVGNSVGNNFAVANPFNFNNSVVTLGGANRTTLVGPITLTNSNTFSI